MQDNETFEERTILSNGTNSTHPWYEDYFLFNACLLSLIFIIATISNCWLSLAVCKSRSLRSATFNLLILHISLVCLAECTLNIPVSFYHNVKRASNCTQPSDSVNEFTLQLIGIELTFGVCVMCIQRWLASWRPDQLKRHLSVGKQTVVIATVWIVGLSFSVPVLSQEFNKGFYERNFVKVNSLYTYFVTSFCYLLPIVIGAVCLCMLFFRRCKDIKNRGLRRLDMTYTEMFFEESYIWNEWESTKLLLVITASYIVTEIPYIVVQHLRKFKYCGNFFNDTIALGTLWLRYSLCCIYPLIIVSMRRDIRQKVGAMLPRRRSSNTRYERRFESWQQASDRRAPLLLATTAGIQFNLLGINIDDLKSKLWVKESSLPVRIEPAIRPTSLPLTDSCSNTKPEECSNFEDATEDEIDCSSLSCPTPVVKEIAVQTSESCPTTPISKEKPSTDTEYFKKRKNTRKNFVLTNPSAKKAKYLPRRFKVVRLKYYRVSLNVHLSTPKKPFAKDRMDVLAEEEC